MRILHTYCLNYNIGDYALGIGVKNLLRNFLDVDLIAETNIQGRYFTEYYINEVVNKKYDLLVIGGGGLIHGAHWPNGWFWLIDKDLIKQIQIPIIVYGVGNNYFHNELIPEKAILHLQETYQRAVFFSVRNDGSLTRIKDQMNIRPYEVPDPGFHVSLNTEYFREINKPYVIVQLANDKSEQRFPTFEEKTNFIRLMNQTLKKLSKDYLILFAPHVFEDIELSKQISAGIDNSIIWNFSNFAFDHCDKAVAYYKYAEFVLAMRGHGQIIPIGFNVPVIALSNHPKHNGLMTELGLEDYCISISDDRFESKLASVINEIRRNKLKIKHLLGEINLNLFEVTSDAFQIIKSKL